LSDDKANLQGWNTNQSKQVGYFGAGVGGTIIGFGATKLAITDDLYRGVEDALSDTQNDRIIQWKEATHDSRLERECSKIDIGTRWSINDVIGQNIENKRYDKSIVVQALNKEQETFCSDVMTTEQYLDIKDRINPDIWSAEYMQNPIDSEGRLFSNLNIINLNEFNKLKSQIEGTIAYIDVSDQGKDYTAMAICAIIKNKVFIVDYLFSQDNTDITIPLCAEKLDKWKVSYCRIESNSMGAMFSRNIQNLTKAKILQVHNTQNKITRIIMQSATINNSFIFVDDETFHYKQFIENLKNFSKEGKNKHDDAPDCLAGLSMFIKSMFTQLTI
jgi:predicted phage terminase large subunit-like protein